MPFSETGRNTHRWLPIADAIGVVAQRLATTPARAWEEIKSNAIHGLLALQGIDENGRLLGIEPYWLHYIEPWRSGDMPDREGGSMIAFDRERAIRDRRTDRRNERQLHSVPPLRIRDLEVDREQLTSLWEHQPRRHTKVDEVKAHLAAKYPDGVPAGMTDKAIARETGVSERTVRRARTSQR